ncbi:hypothetical protein D3C80_1457070 [compost metagenome]
MSLYLRIWLMRASSRFIIGLIGTLSPASSSRVDLMNLFVNTPLATSFRSATSRVVNMSSPACASFFQASMMKREFAASNSALTAGLDERVYRLLIVNKVLTESIDSSSHMPDLSSPAMMLLALSRLLYEPTYIEGSLAITASAALVPIAPNN